MLNFKKKPVIACIHLLPTLGSHQYDGNIEKIYETAISDAKIFLKNHVDALIVENFRDGPFFPKNVPPETIATIAGVAREIIKISDIPVGIAVLRNDAEGALAIAAAVNAQFIRVNVHVGAVLSEQGIIEGNCYKTLRLRENLKSKIQIYADVHVKHSKPLVYPDIVDEVKDASARADGIIVSGAKTGIETDSNKLYQAKENTEKPVLIGSGVTPENIEKIYSMSDGFIVGSYFKNEGKGHNPVDEKRVEKFMNKIVSLRR